MKIGLVVHRFPPDIGGSERYTEVLAEKFYEAGHEITVYTTKHPDRDPTAFPYSIREFTNWIPENFGYFGWPGIFTLKTLRDLRDQDVVHVVGADMFSAVVGVMAKRLFGMPIVLTCFYHPPEMQVHRRLKKGYDQIVLQRVFREYDSMLVSSDFERAQLESNFDLTGCNVVQMDIPPTAETRPAGDFRKENGLEGNFLVLYVGRLDSHKGMSTLLPAIEELSDVIPSLRCVVVGEKERWHEWPERVSVAIKRNRDQFMFPGVLTDGDLTAVYEAADVFVLPSEYETYGLVVVEALSFGTPVVTTEVGIAPELIEDGINGYIYEKNNQDDLVRQVRRVWNKDLDTMKSRASESVADLSWDGTISELIRLYEG